MTRHSIFLTLVLVVIYTTQQGSFGAEPQVGTDEEVRKMNKANAMVGLLMPRPDFLMDNLYETLRDFQNEQPKNCGSQHLKDAVLFALDVEIVAEGMSDPYIDQASRIIEVNQRSASVNLEVADVALAAGCLDVADNIYRNVISRYTGFAYSAHRQRAQIGIDDVRTKRASEEQ